MTPSSLIRKTRRLPCRRNGSGALLIELTASAFLYLVFAVLSVHIGMVIFGAFINDAACRDAARAAGQTQPQATQQQTLARATQMAQAVLVSHQQKNSFIGSPTLVQPIIYQGYNGTPPAKTSPYVQVTTKTQVKLPTGVFSFFGAMFGGDNLSFSQTYTFPIVVIQNPPS